MSTSSEQDHLEPNNPMYYGPRRLREGEKSRLTASHDTNPGLPKNSVSSPSSFDTLLMEAVNNSPRNPLDPEAIHEPPEYDNGLGQWTEPIPVARWFAAAVGVSAFAALFFVIIIPASRDHAQDSNASGFLEALKTAFKQAPREGESKPALAEFETILATNRAAQPAEPAMTHEQSEALLHQFLQWQQKLDSTDSPPQ
jgi:hypothetical protein